MLDGREAGAGNGGLLCAGQLQDAHKIAARRGGREQFSRQGEASVLEEQGGMDHFDRPQAGAFLSHVQVVQFQLWENGKPPPGNRRLYRCPPRGLSCADQCAPIHCRRRCPDGDGSRPAKGQRFGKQVGQRRKLANARGAHVAFIVLQGDLQPWLFHFRMIRWSLRAREMASAW